MKCLIPTVNVLYTLSDTLGEGIGLVIFTMSSLSRIRALTSFSQGFSPAKVLFAGIGVLLLVGYLLLSFAAHFDVVFLGRQRRQREPRYSRPFIQSDRILLPSARDLHRGATYYRYDRHNCRNHGRGTEHHWDGDQGSEAGSNE